MNLTHKSCFLCDFFVLHGKGKTHYPLNTFAPFNKHFGDPFFNLNFFSIFFNYNINIKVCMVAV